jgi:hypothetical protein
MELEFSLQTFRKKLIYQITLKSVQLEANFSHVDGYDEAVVAFNNLGNVSQNSFKSNNQCIHYSITNEIIWYYIMFSDKPRDSMLNFKN